MLNPETDSILSKVPPEIPKPLPDSCGTAAPNDATNGQSGEISCLQLHQLSAYRRLVSQRLINLIFRHY